MLLRDDIREILFAKIIAPTVNIANLAECFARRQRCIREYNNRWVSLSRLLFSPFVQAAISLNPLMYSPFQRHQRRTYVARETHIRRIIREFFYYKKRREKEEEKKRRLKRRPIPSST